MTSGKAFIAIMLLIVSWQAARAASPADARDSPDARIWREECGACHLAYPPRFLPSSAWTDMMRGLKDHFGTDASVDEHAAAQITRYLAANASRKQRTSANGSALRITQTRWFLHEHKDIPATKWKNPSVGSASNCSACHRNAKQGRFGEHSIKIPQ